MVQDSIKKCRTRLDGTRFNTKKAWVKTTARQTRFQKPCFRHCSMPEAEDRSSNEENQHFKILFPCTIWRQRRVNFVTMR